MAGKPDVAEHRHVLGGDDPCIEFKAADEKAMEVLKRRFKVFHDNYQVEFYAPEDIPLKGKYIEVEDSELFGGHTAIQGINGARITCLDALNVGQDAPMRGGILQRAGPGSDQILLTVGGMLMSYGIKYDSKKSEAPAQDPQ